MSKLDVKVQVRFDDDTHRRVKAAATRMGVSDVEAIRRLVRRGLEAHAASESTALVGEALRDVLREELSGLRHVALTAAKEAALTHEHVRQLHGDLLFLVARLPKESVFGYVDNADTLAKKAAFRVLSAPAPWRDTDLDTGGEE
jgi:hypothetical protein